MIQVPVKRALSPDLAEVATRQGRDLGVSGAIHPDDFIFWYIHDDDTLADKLEAPRRYLQSGRSTLDTLSQYLGDYGVQLALAERPEPLKRISLLEFASGYGRVTRHFSAQMPELDVVACDIHAEAIGFLEGLGLQAVQSSSVPERLSVDRLFNIVFAFSFFTHMPRATWSRWLRALADQLEPNGLLIFTAHGAVSQPLMGVAALEPDGFFFHTDSEQKDLDGAQYGNTVTTFEFVAHEVSRCGLKLLQFRQAGAGHHDVYIAQKKPGAIRYVSRDEAGMTAENDALRVENDALRAEVQALRLSRSWKLTDPLRRMSSLLYRRT